MQMHVFATSPRRLHWQTATHNYILSLYLAALLLRLAEEEPREQEFLRATRGRLAKRRNTLMRAMASWSGLLFHAWGKNSGERTRDFEDVLLTLTTS